MEELYTALEYARHNLKVARRWRREVIEVYRATPTPTNQEAVILCYGAVRAARRELIEAKAEAATGSDSEQENEDE